MFADQLFSKIELFSGLEPAEVEEIRRAATPFKQAAGELLFRQADEANHMFIIGTGRIQILLRTPGDEEMVVAELGEGDILGELSLLDRGSRTASARCIEATTGYSISRDSVQGLLWRGSNAAGLKVMRRILEIASARLRMVTGNIAASVDIRAGTPNARTPNARPAPRTDVPAGSRRPIDANTLRRIPFFSEFDPLELDHLLTVMKRRDLPRGHVLFEEGDEAASCFVVVRGAVELMVNRGEAWERLALLGPGKIVGLMALIDSSPFSATCCVRENAILLELTAQEFDRLFEADSRIGTTFIHVLIRLLAERLLDSERRLSRLALEGKMQSD